MDGSVEQRLRSSAEPLTTSDEDSSDLDDVPLFLRDHCPQNSAAGAQTARQRQPLAALPLKTALRSNGTDEQCSPPPSTRGRHMQLLPTAALATPDPAVEPLPSSRSGRPPGQLRLPQSAGVTTVPGLSLRTAQQQPSPETQQPSSISNTVDSSNAGMQPGTTNGTLVQVSLLSPVFCLTEPDSGGGSQQGPGTLRLSDSAVQHVTQRCTQALGVAPQQLRLFTLQPHHRNGDPGGGTLLVAVQVDNSSFSLTALEDMMAQNAKLQATQQSNAQTISTMYQDMRALQGEHNKLLVSSTQQAEQLKAQMDRNLALQEEVATLRAQLQASDELRQRLQSAIKELRRNFQ